MSFIKGFLDAVFGATTSPPNPRPVDSARPVEPQEFSDAAIADAVRVRQQVRQSFEADHRETEAALGLAEKQKRLERAQAFLRKADIEPLFNAILKETWNWPSWKEKGELDDLPTYGLDVIEVVPRRTLENKHQVHGYTIAIGGRTYEISFLDKGHGYTPDGPSDRHGEIGLNRDGELLFACSISERGDEYYTTWRLNLFGLRALRDVSWLPDIAGFAEIVTGRAAKRQKTWNARRIADQTADIIDPTGK
mgnify:CR=1 FL=1